MFIFRNWVETSIFFISNTYFGFKIYNVIINSTNHSCMHYSYNLLNHKKSVGGESWLSFWEDIGMLQSLKDFLEDGIQETNDFSRSVKY